MKVTKSEDRLQELEKLESIDQAIKEFQDGEVLTTEQYIESIKIGQKDKEMAKAYVEQVYRANRLRKGLRL